MEEELFSPYVVDILVREGMRPESVLLTACCDKSLDNEFEDTFVFLSIDRLAFLTVSYDGPVQKVYNGFIAKKRKPSDQKKNVPCKKKKYQEYKISEIKELKLVNLVASGVAYLKFEDGEKETLGVGGYTNACVGDLSKIAKAVGKIKENGVLNIAEFKDKNDEDHCPKCGREYIDKQRKVCPKCADRKSTFKRLMRLLPQYKLYVFLAFLGIMASTALSAISPVLQGQILFDKVITPGSGFWYGKIGLVVILIALLYIVYQAALGVTSIYMNKFSQKMVYDMKMDIFKSFETLSMGYITKNRIGSIMNRINNDTSAIASFFVNGIPYIIRNALQFVIGIVMLINIKWQVILFALIPTFVIVFVLKITRNYMWRLYQKSWSAGSSLTSSISDSLKGVKVVKAFGKEKDEISRFDRINKKYFKIQYKLCYTLNLLNPIYSLTISLVTYGIWVMCGLDRIGGGEMNYGTMLTILSYFSMMLSPIASFSSFTEWWRSAMNAAQRMYDLIDAESDVKESKTPVIIDKVKGDISISNMNFGYEPNQTILNNINIDIKSGEMIGIVGHSGAGKSTLINLITRMYDVDEGSISIDGYNIKDVAIRTLRRNISLVTQDTYIFQGTVLENIAYGRPDATRDEVIAAAKIAKCHDFIEAMPEGYDTMVGAGYRSMSGGERQRLSIARAVLINPRILILDEATAALDTETEMSIQDALDSLTAGRTTLAIAHRLSTLRNADRLVVIEGGKIAEAGTHNELIQNKGVYYRLMLKQAEALKTKGI